MKNTKIILGLLTLTICLASCINSTENAESNDEMQQDTSQQMIQEDSSENTDPEISLEEIDQLRSDIENSKTEAIEISTTNLREKIKQKWSKIHFYVENDVVVKIKTYPYSQISKRTEEFYASEEGLRLVVIEDNGDEPKGKSKNEIDRMYYFNNDMLIGELKKGEEQDYENNKSVSERLISEFQDYMTIYEENKK
jgi:hypothetical protein